MVAQRRLIGLMAGLGLHHRHGPFGPLRMRFSTAAALAIAEWVGATFPMRCERIHSPPDSITSFTRSVICMAPWGSMVAMSPVSQYPCSSSTRVSSR